MMAVRWFSMLLIVTAAANAQTAGGQGSDDTKESKTGDLLDFLKPASRLIEEGKHLMAEPSIDQDEDVVLKRAAAKFRRAMRHDPSNPAGLIEFAKTQRRMKVQQAYGSSFTPAAEMSLRWLARNQIEDGGWSFWQNKDAAIPDSGNSRSRIEATAIAILPFIGAGYTHQDGKYKDVVRPGIQFLASEMRLDEDRGDLRGKHGDMTTHGIATLVLCEVFGMTNDRALAALAQAAIRYIEYTQNEDGGWSAESGGKSDMAVSNWQVLALHSAALSQLKFSPKTIRRFRDFLASMQSKDGSYFGRTAAGKDTLATAVGLLWRVKFNETARHDERLRRAAEYLVSDQSRFDDCLTNYVVSMALYQYDGPDGTLWKTCREQLVGTLLEAQIKVGFARGTWFTEEDESAEHGGRLFQTAMKVCALEVYYRYLPVYQKKNQFNLPEVPDDVD